MEFQSCSVSFLFLGYSKVKSDRLCLSHSALHLTFSKMASSWSSLNELAQGQSGKRTFRVGLSIDDRLSLQLRQMKAVLPGETPIYSVGLGNDKAAFDKWSNSQVLTGQILIEELSATFAISKLFCGSRLKRHMSLSEAVLVFVCQTKDLHLSRHEVRGPTLTIATFHYNRQGQGPSTQVSYRRAAQLQSVYLV